MVILDQYVMILIGPFAWKNSLELIELSSINKVSLVYVSSCSNNGSIDDPCWTAKRDRLELILFYFSMFSVYYFMFFRSW